MQGTCLPFLAPFARDFREDPLVGAGQMLSSWASRRRGHLLHPTWFPRGPVSIVFRSSSFGRRKLASLPSYSQWLSRPQKKVFAWAKEGWRSNTPSKYKRKGRTRFLLCVFLVRQEAPKIGREQFCMPLQGGQTLKATGKVDSESKEKDPQFIATCLPAPENNRLKCEGDWFRLEIKKDFCGSLKSYVTPWGG